MITAMLVLCGVLGAAGVFFGARKIPGVEYVKALYPLSLLFFTLWALTHGRHSLLAAGILLGLVFCVPGDFILGKRDNSRLFIFGLAGFLLAYLCYGVTFLGHGVLGSASIGVAALLILASGLQYTTFRSLPRAMREPVLVYIVVVSLMLFGAASFVLAPDPTVPRKMLLLGGAFLIYTSDSLIAHNLFRVSIPHSDLFILPPYYAGQLLIVLQLFLD